MARSTCVCGETILWKADEPQSGEYLLVAMKDFPEELSHESLDDVSTYGARCSQCGRLYFPVGDRRFGSWAPEEAWVWEGRMPRQSDMGVVGWKNYIAVQVAQAFVGNVGPLITDIAAGWVDGIAWVYVAATGTDVETDAEISEAVAELDALLGGDIEIRVDRYIGQAGPEWPGYRERRIFGRRK